MARKHLEVDASVSDMNEVVLNVMGGGPERRWLPLTKGLLSAAGTVIVNTFTNGIIPAALLGPLGVVGMPALIGSAAIIGAANAGLAYVADVPQSFIKTKRKGAKGDVKVMSSLNQKINEKLGGADGRRNITLKTLFGAAAGLAVAATMFTPAAPVMAAGTFLGGLVGGVTSWLGDVRRKYLQVGVPVA